MTINEAHEHIGSKVEYTPFNQNDKSKKEYGIITSANDRNVFVKYGNDFHSKSTNPRDLKLIGVGK